VVVTKHHHTLKVSLHYLVKYKYKNIYKYKKYKK